MRAHILSNVFPGRLLCERCEDQVAPLPAEEQPQTLRHALQVARQRCSCLPSVDKMPASRCKEDSKTVCCLAVSAAFATLSSVPGPSWRSPSTRGKNAQWGAVFQHTLFSILELLTKSICLCWVQKRAASPTAKQDSSCLQNTRLEALCPDCGMAGPRLFIKNNFTMLKPRSPKKTNSP